MRLALVGTCQYHPPWRRCCDAAKPAANSVLLSLKQQASASDGLFAIIASIVSQVQLAQVACIAFHVLHDLHPAGAESVRRTEPLWMASWRPST